MPVVSACTPNGSLVEYIMNMVEVTAVANAAAMTAAVPAFMLA